MFGLLKILTIKCYTIIWKRFLLFSRLFGITEMWLFLETMKTVLFQFWESPAICTIFYNKKANMNHVSYCTCNKLYKPKNKFSRLLGSLCSQLGFKEKRMLLGLWQKILLLSAIFVGIIKDQLFIAWRETLEMFLFQLQKS